MSSLALSVILYAALHSGQSCESVFVQTAMAANHGLPYGGEELQLDDLAQAACRSSNPDVIWQIAHTESNFRFLIVRDNRQKQAEVLRGDKAQRLIEALPQKAANVDVGVLQLNWTWHRQYFQNQPARMLTASGQVKYLLESFGEFIYKRCANRWMGCYHNPTNEAAAQRYEKIVRKNGHLLKALSLRYAEEVRRGMNPEQRAELPLWNAEDFDRLAQTAPGLPQPVREFLALAHYLPFGAVRMNYPRG